MVVPDGEWEAMGRESHAVVDEAKAAGVYVFGGGVDEDVAPALVSVDGRVTQNPRTHCPEDCGSKCDTAAFDLHGRAPVFSVLAGRDAQGELRRLGFLIEQEGCSHGNTQSAAGRWFLVV